MSKPGGFDSVGLPPAQTRTVLEGLASDDPRQQYAALDLLGRFPNAVKGCREQIERLEKESRHEPIRKKAAEVLASIKETSPPE